MFYTATCRLLYSYNLIWESGQPVKITVQDFKILVPIYRHFIYNEWHNDPCMLTVGILLLLFFFGVLTWGSTFSTKPLKTSTLKILYSSHWCRNTKRAVYKSVVKIKIVMVYQCRNHRILTSLVPKCCWVCAVWRKIYSHIPLKCY